MTPVQHIITLNKPTYHLTINSDQPADPSLPYHPSNHPVSQLFSERYHCQQSEPIRSHSDPHASGYTYYTTTSQTKETEPIDYPTEEEINDAFPMPAYSDEDLALMKHMYDDLTEEKKPLIESTPLNTIAPVQRNTFPLPVVTAYAQQFYPMFQKTRRTLSNGYNVRCALPAPQPVATVSIRGNTSRQGSKLRTPPKKKARLNPIPTIETGTPSSSKTLAQRKSNTRMSSINTIFPIIASNSKSPISQMKRTIHGPGVRKVLGLKQVANSNGGTVNPELVQRKLDPVGISQYKRADAEHKVEVEVRDGQPQQNNDESIVVTGHGHAMKSTPDIVAEQKASACDIQHSTNDTKVDLKHVENEPPKEDTAPQVVSDAKEDKSLQLRLHLEVPAMTEKTKVSYMGSTGEAYVTPPKSLINRSCTDICPSSTSRDEWDTEEESYTRPSIPHTKRDEPNNDGETHSQKVL
jgi:hypothetical protein